LSSPAPPRPAQDGGAVAEEPGPDPCRHRRTGRRLPTLRAALPRRIRAGRTRPRAPPQLAGQGLRVGRAPALPGGLLFEHPPRSAREAQEAIERLTGIRRGLSQVRAFLKKKLGWPGARSARSPRRWTPTSRRAT